jgi:WD40 repeat protein
MIRLLALVALAAPHVDQHGDPLPDGAITRFGTVRYRIGTERSIRSWALSPLGKTLAVEDRFGIGLWDIETGRCTHPYSPNLITDEHGRYGLCYSPDGKYLARLAGTSVSVIDASTGVWRFATSLKEIGRGGRSIAYVPGQPNRLVVTSAEESKAFFIDATLGRIESTLQAKDAVQTLSPKGNFFFGKWGVLPHLIDAKTGEMKCRFFDLARVNTDCVVSNDDRWLYATDGKGRLLKCDVESGKVVEELESAWDSSFGGRIRLTLSGESDTAYLASPGQQILRRDLKAGRWLEPLPQSSGGPVFGLPGGNHALQIERDGRLRLYDLNSLRELPTVDGFEAIAFTAPSPDGHRIAAATAGFPSRQELFDTAGKLLRSALTTCSGSQPHWSTDGHCVAFVGGTEITVRDAATWKILHVLTATPDRKHSGVFAGPAFFLPDANRLAVPLLWGETLEIAVFDLKSGKQLRTIRIGVSGSAALSPDGKTLAINSATRGVALLDLAAERQKVGWVDPLEDDDRPTYRKPLFSPDGSFLLTWKTEQSKLQGEQSFMAVIRDPVTCKQCRSFKIDTNSSFGFALSADGLWLASGNEIGDLHLWDVAAGTHIGRWKCHRGSIQNVHFAGPGRVLTSSADLTALLWELRPKDKPDKPLWDALAGNDALEAYRAVWAIADDPRGPELLRSKIALERPLPMERTNQLLADLGADKYAVREAATKNLLTLGRLMEADLRTTFERTTSEEVRTRSESLLAKIVPERSPQEYLHARAVAAMEIAGTADARKLLAEWATGAARARLTLDAKAALGRLAIR